ncbi:flagellar motor switch protein FliG [Blastococcus sp. PRF04-17]|uniref:flagellar motor switch protein FliG n=1 Tax=Blastococcus sp. PRF04-17 TaxID=2933797 RepID=UPI002111B52F|nr:flagellar motor switch protein FliG [Blastococcus sp. PRF04-17]
MRTLAQRDRGATVAVGQADTGQATTLPPPRAIGRTSPPPHDSRWPSDRIHPPEHPTRSKQTGAPTVSGLAALLPSGTAARPARNPGETEVTADSASDRPLPGLRKAAVFLAQMSKDEAGLLMGKLRPREIEAVTRELVRLGSVEAEDVDDVMTEFHGLMTAQRYVGHGGVEMAREMLAAGFGEDKADDLLARVNAAYRELPFSSLRNADVRQLVTFLKDEHPQVIALVLAHLTAAQSAEVLSGFAPEQQAEVAHRIATMDRTSPEMVRLVEEELARRMGSILAHQDMTTVGGVEALVEIINHSPRPTERSILEWLDTADADLAERVRSQMFVFEDIVILDDRSLQQVLREVEANDLATALKGVRADVHDKVTRNLSERAAENLAEEIDLLGPVRMSTVEEAQARIVATIRALEERGELTINRSDEDLIS